ncbi:signal peptidase II [Paracoccus pacificus]|uniref:Lipoprotein signal peptidase n=1 Tax=Paracoccus pacificus TaxID=1463598 RepID=A0ABW4R6S1_9RHOB
MAQTPKPTTPPENPAEAATGASATPKPRTPRKRKPAAPPPPPGYTMRLTAIVAAVTLLIDQISKYIVVHILRLDSVRELDLINPFLNLRMAWNQGVNFGLLSSGANAMRWVLIAVAVAVSIWVWVWLARTQRAGLAGRSTRIAAGLLIGGALGNAIDRLTYGAVADFLNMSLPGWQNPYSFNTADIAVFAGAIGLVLFPPATPEPNPPTSSKARDAQRKSR